MTFNQHAADLAYAIRKGDIPAAEMALDMMARDREIPRREAIEIARCRANRDMGRIAPLPRLAQPDLVTTAGRLAAA